MIIRKDTLKDQAYKLIRDKIFTQEISFGSWLNVAELSRELGISNSPIREAISMLETDGLIVNVPNCGFHVISFNKIMFDENSQAISVILRGCCDELMRNGRGAELAIILKERLTIQKSKNTGKVTFEYANAAIDFDRSFVEACDNKMLNLMFQSKFNLLVLSVIKAYEDNDSEIDNNINQHEKILAAVEANDRIQTLDLIHSHFDKRYIHFKNTIGVVTQE